MNEREERALLYERVKRETGKYPWEGLKMNRCKSFEDFLDKTAPELDKDEIMDEIRDRLGW